jgi:hypothetical protein
MDASRKRYLTELEKPELLQWLSWSESCCSMAQTDAASESTLTKKVLYSLTLLKNFHVRMVTLVSQSLLRNMLTWQKVRPRDIGVYSEKAERGGGAEGQAR